MLLARGRRAVGGRKEEERKSLNFAGMECLNLVLICCSYVLYVTLGNCFVKLGSLHESFYDEESLRNLCSSKKLL
jgi:hypothetical protein